MKVLYVRPLIRFFVGNPARVYYSWCWFRSWTHNPIVLNARDYFQIQDKKKYFFRRLRRDTLVYSCIARCMQGSFSKIDFVCLFTFWGMAVFEGRGLLYASWKISSKTGNTHKYCLFSENNYCCDLGISCLLYAGSMQDYPLHVRSKCVPERWFTKSPLPRCKLESMNGNGQISQSWFSQVSL